MGSSERALILGVGGMDGSILAEILLDRSLEVHGFYRRSSVDNLARIRHVRDRLTLHQGDLSDPLSIDRVLCDVMPSWIFNEADQDHVDWSFATPGYSMDVTAGAVCRTLESVRRVAPHARVFQPVSATMFGDAAPPQNEQTPLCPLSPYACAKAAAYHVCRYYRRVHGLFVSTGILYNHDSVRRGEGFLLHRVCSQAVRVAAGLQKAVRMGNLGLGVDIGCAREFMEAACAILQLDAPDDFVIGTGVAWSVRQIVFEALDRAGFEGQDLYHLVEADDFQRPGPLPTLRADAGKLKAATGWLPQRAVWDLIDELVRHYQTGTRS